MSKPIFAEADLSLLKKCILLTLKNPQTLTAEEKRNLEKIYHRMGRTNRPTVPAYSPDAPWIQDD